MDAWGLRHGPGRLWDYNQIQVGLVGSTTPFGQRNQWKNVSSKYTVKSLIWKTVSLKLYLDGKSNPFGYISLRWYSSDLTFSMCPSKLLHMRNSHRDLCFTVVGGFIARPSSWVKLLTPLFSYASLWHAMWVWNGQHSQIELICSNQNALIKFKNEWYSKSVHRLRLVKR